jgi:general secretion pathway protein H
MRRRAATGRPFDIYSYGADGREGGEGQDAISAIGTTRLPHHYSPARNGFTLVELMVVLFIIALMSAAVLAALPESGALASEAERFARAPRRRRSGRDGQSADRDPRRPGRLCLRLAPGGRVAADRGSALRRSEMERRHSVEAGEGRILFDSTGFAEPANTGPRPRRQIEFAVEIAKGGDVHVRP